MASSSHDRDGPQIYLVTPPGVDENFAGLLETILEAVPVAALLITPATDGSADAYQRLCKTLVPMAQAAGAAALTVNDTQISGRSSADGVHLTGSLKDLKEVLCRFKPQRIVGAGAIRTRHDAMVKGETQPDYLLFGDVFGEVDLAEAHDLAAWWADLFQVPCVAMAASDLDSVVAAAQTGADFVGLGPVIWEADSPEDAIKSAYQVLSAS